MSSSEPVMPGGRRFLAWLLATAALLSAAVLAMTWLVDPYGLLSARGETPGLCTPGILSYDDRYLKPVLARLYQPEEIVLGSSRALSAFSEDSFTRRTGRRTVNLALSGGSLEEVDWLARAAVAEAPVRRVWIGLDFGAFVTPEPEATALTPLWSVTNADATALRYGLLDPHALRAGVLVLADPAVCREPGFTAHGFILSAEPYAGTSGALPVLPDVRTRTALIQQWRLERGPNASTAAAHMARLDALLDFLRRRGVSTILFITPSHPVYHAMVAEAGLTARYRGWRDEVRAIAARHGATLVMSDSPAFLGTIRAPDCPDGTASLGCLFYDSTHARPIVGDAIVRAALAAERPRLAPQ